MKLKPVFLYTLYFLAAVLVFCIVLFPEEPASRMVSARFNQAFKQVRLETGPLSPALPAGFSAETGSLTWFGRIQTPIENLKLTLLPQTLFKSEKNLGFRAGQGQGTLQGTMTGFNAGTNRFSTLDLDFANLAVNGFEWKSPRYNLVLSLLAGGTLAVSKTQKTLQGTAVFTDFKIRLPGPGNKQGPAPSIAFSRMDLEYKTEKDRLMLTKCTAAGKDFNLELSGSISLSGRGALALKGSIKPSPQFFKTFDKHPAMKRLFQKAKAAGHIPVSLSGTVQNPLLRFR